MTTLDDQLDHLPDTRARPPSAGARAAAHSQTAGLMSVLSLFLLLLAFFILLNSIAQFETRRTRAVLGSLAATFNVSDPSGRSRTLGSFVGHVQAVADLDRKITGLLRTLVGFGSFELIRTGNLLSTTIDNSVLFTDGAGASPHLRALIEPTAGLLAAASREVIVEVAIYARPAGGKVVSARSAAIEAAAARAATVVQTFAEYGVAARQLVVALEDGDPRKTRIEFRVLENHPDGGDGQ